MVAMAALLASTGLYTVLGGVRASSYIEFIQTLIMVLALVCAVPVVLVHVGGFTALGEYVGSIEPRTTGWWFSWKELLAFGMSFGFGIAAAMLPTLTPVTQIEPKQFNQALTLNVLATQALLAQAQRLAYDVQQIDRAFASTYAQAGTGQSQQQLFGQARERWQNSVAALQDALRVQATVVGNIDKAMALASQEPSGPKEALNGAVALWPQRVWNSAGRVSSQTVARENPPLTSRPSASAADAACGPRTKISICEPTGAPSIKSPMIDRPSTSCPSRTTRTSASKVSASRTKRAAARA